MSQHQRKILILFAHPSIDRSEVNVELLRASRQIDAVTVVDLYHDYPDYQIDIDREQQRLREHDVVVFMFPLFWYSTPAMLKEWQDLVLEYGFAYGSEGTALRGKIFLCATTAGGAEDAYHSQGYNHFTIRELLQPLEQTAVLCGMRFVAPFALYGSRTAVEEGRVAEHVQDWVKVLLALRDQTMDLKRACELPMLNQELDQLIRQTP
jgi:glutathione-regulated potassium-efflux system ancillary protein KefG